MSTANFLQSTVNVIGPSSWDTLLDEPDIGLRLILNPIILFIKMIWVWVNTYRYIFSGMNIHLPAILGFH